MRVILPVCAVLLLCAQAAVGSDEIDLEMSPLIEKAKSPVQAERVSAVTELIGLREAVAERLGRAVADSNRGVLSDDPKAVALYLLGELGLVQFKDMLEGEGDWEPTFTYPDRQSALLARVENRWFNKVKPFPAAQALNRLLRPAPLTYSSRPAADLAAYPALSEALDNLRVANYETVKESGGKIERWHEVIWMSFSSVLSRRMRKLYGDDVKITAIYVLGEFRARCDRGLLSHMDLEDGADLTAAYPATLSVETPDKKYPAAVALLKIGRHTDSRAFVSKLTDESIDQETRKRIARTAAAVAPDEAREAFIQALAHCRASGYKKEAKRLVSVESILNP